MGFRHLATRLTLVAVVLSVASVAVGNVPPPEPQRPIPPRPQVVNRGVVVRESNDGGYRIIIPRSVLKDLKIAAASVPAGAQEPERSRWQYRSLLAALAMSAGMISLVLVRRRSASTRVLAVMALAGATYFAGNASADLALSPRPPDPAPPANPAPKAPMIAIEMVPRGQSVQLFLPAVKPEGRGVSQNGAGLGPEAIEGEEGPPNANPPSTRGVGSPGPEVRRAPLQPKPQP